MRIDATRLAGTSGRPTAAHTQARWPVPQRRSNAWGLCGMHGNVEEWCLDWYGPYEADEQVDPVGHADGDFRVTRGGGHSDFTRMLRSANRSGRLPESANDRIGFRVVIGPRPMTPPLPVPPAPLNARDVKLTAAPKVDPVKT